MMTESQIDLLRMDVEAARNFLTLALRHLYSDPQMRGCATVVQNAVAMLERIEVQLA